MNCSLPPRLFATALLVLGLFCLSPAPLSAAETNTGTNCCHTPSSRAAEMLGKNETNAATQTSSSTPISSASKEAPKPPVSHSSTPKLSNTAKWPVKPWPHGMVWIPAGEFEMGGVGPEAREDEFPVHSVKVDGFWMDETVVTNSAFRAFVKATGYLTTAERKPDWEEMKKTLPSDTPRPPDEVLVPGSLVFVPTEGPVPLNDVSQWWHWVPGASWRHPLGPKSSLSAKDEEYPVVHVSWDDAVAYCKWAGKRLPTESEWEYASLGGGPARRFMWGEEPPSDTFLPANLWQGGFPYEKKPLDGYLLIAPARSFGPNGYGLYNMIGNVWQWCADWYREDTYALLSKGSLPAVNPQGPSNSHDPDEPLNPKRVNRGGSFLCNAGYCASYRPAARMKTSPDSGLLHTGFRAVMSDAEWRKKAEK